jgi:hypothetical protein
MNTTDVCNMALGMIGQNYITAIDDGTHTANQCKAFFEPARDACLRDHLWNFALKRQALAQNAVAPVSGWTYGYNLPADCLRVIELNGDNELQWAIEDRVLVTNEPAAKIYYIAKLDPADWDALFLDAFTMLLASKLALAIAHDAAYSAAILKLYSVRLLDAKAVDAQENGLEDALEATDLIDVRNT